MAGQAYNTFASRPRLVPSWSIGIDIVIALHAFLKYLIVFAIISMMIF